MDFQAFLDRFQFDPNQPLGEGGFAKVYKAFDKTHNRWVALKQSQVSPSLKYSLLREVENAKDLRHPNLMQYLEGHRFQTQQGTFDYAVMELVNGTSLDKYLESAPTPLQLVNMLTGILKGLRYLHQRNVIHRDLKASNILIHYEGGKQEAKIIDFGISKDIGKEEMTLSSQIVGTCAYMAPEQLQMLSGEQNNITPGSDLWAFGVVLYRLQLGVLPFGADYLEVRDRIPKGLDPQQLEQMPSNFRKIVTRCVVLDPQERCKNADELLEILHSTTVDLAKELQQAKALYKQSHFSKAFRMLFDMQGNLYLDPEAMFLYAKMYEDGNAIPRNLDAARDYYRQASELGYAPAKAALDNLNNQTNVVPPVARAEQTAVMASPASGRVQATPPPIGPPGKPASAAPPASGKKKRSPIPFILLGLALVGLAIAAFLLTRKNGENTNVVGAKTDISAKFMKDFSDGFKDRISLSDSLDHCKEMFEKAKQDTLYASLSPDSLREAALDAYRLCKTQEDRGNKNMANAEAFLPVAPANQKAQYAAMREAAEKNVQSAQDSRKTIKELTGVAVPGNLEADPKPVVPVAVPGAPPVMPPVIPAPEPAKPVNAKFEKAGNGKWGLVDKNSGRVVISYEYDEHIPFGGSVGALRRGKLWAIVNNKGEFLTSFQYTTVGKLQGRCGGLRLFGARGGNEYYIDDSGRESTSKPEDCI